MKTLAKYTNQVRGKIGDTLVFNRALGMKSQERSSPQISASLLAVNNAQDSALWAVAACRAGAERIHIDVNDGNEKPSGIARAEGVGNTSQLFIPRQLDSIKETIHEARFQTPIDVHLVIEQPSEELLDSYLDAGADSVAIHWVTLARPMKVDQKTGGNKKNAFSICRHEVVPKETDKNSCLSLFEA